MKCEAAEVECWGDCFLFITPIHRREFAFARVAPGTVCLGIGVGKWGDGYEVLHRPALWPENGQLRTG